ncbi:MULTISPECIES: prepilin peptidase [Paenalcaligenes]|uniref:Prepilin type IV endopeptidase peptidase domain-containing protein n=1 Tax=Paenalcaligenes hermetiae TaxID=1157987 RepID=A0ABP9LSF9_9BURK|nr:A24 family peptidase [Paenalcaligenes sp.]
MYLWALYIGLSAAVISRVYLDALPFYAQRVHLGQTADESLWWMSVRHGFLQRSSYALVWRVGTAGLFGMGLAVFALYWPWLPTQPDLNVVMMSVWLGCLLCLARIDALCRLLPDVLTQLLLWIGLLYQLLISEPVVTQALWGVLGSYVFLRALNAFCVFCFKHPVMGHGDVKLLVALSAWLGLGTLGVLWFWAALFCFIIQIIWQKTCWPTGQCAFGPYLVAAAFLVWLLPDSRLF